MKVGEVTLRGSSLIAEVSYVNDLEDQLEITYESAPSRCPGLTGP